MKMILPMFLFVSVIGVSLERPALAQVANPQVDPAEAALQKSLEDQIAKLGAPSLKATGPKSPSPSIGFAGVVIGAAAGHTTGSGNDTSIAGGIKIRSYGEGGSGPQDLSGIVSPDIRGGVNAQIQDLAYREAVASGLTDPTQIQNKTMEIADKMKSRFEPLVTRLEQAAADRRAAEALKPSRPLYVFELDGKYNMVGVQGLGTSNKQAFTGVTGHMKAGVGFAMKDFGANGCTMYFMAQGSADGSVYYQLENADAASVNVGIEQGPLCQIGHALTIMASPSVQAGGNWHGLPEGGMISTGWLNFAGHVRIIVDNRLYTALNAVYHPAMGGSSWSSTELDGTADYKVSDQWFVGLDGKSETFNNTASGATGTTQIQDKRVQATATLLF